MLKRKLKRWNLMWSEVCFEMVAQMKRIFSINSFIFFSLFLFFIISILTTLYQVKSESQILMLTNMQTEFKKKNLLIKKFRFSNHTNFSVVIFSFFVFCLCQTDILYDFWYKRRKYTLEKNYFHQGYSNYTAGFLSEQKFYLWLWSKQLSNNNFLFPNYFSNHYSIHCLPEKLYTQISGYRCRNFFFVFHFIMLIVSNILFVKFQEVMFLPSFWQFKTSKSKPKSKYDIQMSKTLLEKK